MTTKETSAVKTIHVATDPKPYMLRLIGPTIPALAEAAVHIRSGYTFSRAVPVEIFGPSGNIALTLELGDPEPYIVENAKATLDAAMVQQRVEYEREVQRAAKQMIEDAARAEKQQQIAAQIAEQQKALRALETALSKA